MIKAVFDWSWNLYTINSVFIAWLKRSKNKTLLICICYINIMLIVTNFKSLIIIKFLDLTIKWRISIIWFYYEINGKMCWFLWQVHKKDTPVDLTMDLSFLWISLLMQLVLTGATLSKNDKKKEKQKEVYLIYLL